MGKTIRVALVGLGSVGEVFAEHFLEKIQEGGMPIEIVAVADRHLDSPIALGFSQDNIPTFADAQEVVKLGDKVNIIFDLTGNSAVRQKLRGKLMESKNHHTVIAPAVLACLLWCFFDQGGDLSWGGQARRRLLAPRSAVVHSLPCHQPRITPTPSTTAGPARAGSADRVSLANRN